MATPKNKKNKSKQKLNAKQRAQREVRALERERLAQEKEQKSARTKRIFTIVVCAILVLALSLPTMALVVMGGN